MNTPVKRQRTENSSSQNRLMLNMATELMTRRMYMEQLGQSYSGNRDLYQALGYPKILTYTDFALRYERQDLAKRIINAPVRGCWSKMPQILEVGEKKDTQFEKEFIELDKRIGLLNKLIRLDKMCGLGRYAVLFFGYAGYQQNDLNQPIKKQKHQLLYLTPFNEGAAEILEWFEDPSKDDYGKPKVYRLTMQVSSAKTTTTKQILVHSSRCVHVADELLNDDVFGTPRLQAVFNRLMDIEKLVGGSGEMFWQGAFPGFAMKADSEFDMTQSAAAITTEVDNYVHQLRRYMKLQGIDVQQLSPQVSDPKNHIDVQLDMISAATGIPKRILLGSERGELASSQDEDNWNDVLSQRREEFCSGSILRPVIDKLIFDSVLLEPKDGYEINWPPLYIQNDQQKAEVAGKRAEALSKFVAGGLDQLMTFDAYLEHICEYDRDVVDLIVASGEGIEKEIEDEDDKDLVANAVRHYPAGSSKGGQFMPLDGGAPSRGEDKTWKDSFGNNLSAAHQIALAKIAIPPKWSEVQINADPQGSPLVRGKDSKGRPVRITNPSVSATGRDEKWERNKNFRLKAKELATAAYQRTLQGDGTAAAALLAMKTGMRPGSDKETKGEVKAFGVSTLQGQHVSIIDKNRIRFKFVGKKGIMQDHIVSSPALVDYLQRRKPDSNDLVFDTDSDKLLDFVKSNTGPDFLTKDVRTWRATVTANRLVSSLPKPENKKELSAAKKQVAEKVSSILGNKPEESLKSYINPVVFSKWEL